MGFAVQQQFQSKFHLGLVTAWFYRQFSVCCYASFFCDGVITTWLGRCLTLTWAGKEGRRWPGTQEPWDWYGDGEEVCLVHRTFQTWWGGKEVWFMISSVTENSCLPYKMALVMLTILPGSGAGVISYTTLQSSHCVLLCSWLCQAGTGAQRGNEMAGKFKHIISIFC